jgi:CrcB protein
MNPAVTTLWIGLGGALGTIARYWIAKWALPISQSLPWGTIGINISGSFVIGFVGTLTLMQGRYPLPETARLFIMVGFCGGFTTFSSFSLQTLDLLRSDAWTRALLNIAVSVLCCLLAVAAGHALASALNGGAQKIAQTATEEEAG